jgi:hypothetical protein
MYFIFYVYFRHLAGKARIQTKNFQFLFFIFCKFVLKWVEIFVRIKLIFTNDNCVTIVGHIFR